MTSAAQINANRLNAQRSTGPRSDVGKARSSQNATKHGLTSRVLVGLAYGPFRDRGTEVAEFVNAVMSELEPVGQMERAEAMAIAALLVRRGRLVELETLALAHSTEAAMLPPEEPGGQPRIAQKELTRAATASLDANFFNQLPRYEGHLSRELDRSLARYSRLQECRRAKSDAIEGEVIEQDLQASELGWLEGVAG